MQSSAQRCQMNNRVDDHRIISIVKKINFTSSNQVKKNASSGRNIIIHARDAFMNINTEGLQTRCKPLVTLGFFFDDLLVNTKNYTVILLIISI